MIRSLFTVVGMGESPYFGNARYAVWPCLRWKSRFCSAVISERLNAAWPPPPPGACVPEALGHRWGALSRRDSAHSSGVRGVLPSLPRMVWPFSSTATASPSSFSENTPLARKMMSSVASGNAPAFSAAPRTESPRTLPWNLAAKDSAFSARPASVFSCLSCSPRRRSVRLLNTSSTLPSVSSLVSSSWPARLSRPLTASISMPSNWVSNWVNLPEVSFSFPSSSEFLVFKPETDASTAVAIAALIAGFSRSISFSSATVMHPLGMFCPPNGHRHRGQTS
ncbi:hypothetical protein 3S13_4 [uncultured Caudovirales phage]|uniref:Uncharacterized protein n=1 Tax=uncultured Caudovirales phage TaxID=2100421 RepID=A0A2H4JHZ6_9CAUD|nr:hypothetical protein 3S13_4 [uncultured Caudovirales phage]